MTNTETTNSPPESDVTRLQMPVQYVRGVGPHRAELLKNLGIVTVRDMLFHVPNGINDFTDLRPVPKLEPDREQSVHGIIVDRELRQLRNNRTLVGVLIDCHGHFVRGIWFNQPWMYKKYRDDDRVVFSGKPSKKAGRWEFSNPRVYVLSPEDDIENAAGVLPRYALTDGIKMDAMRQMTRTVTEQFAHLVPDPIPESFRAAHSLPDLPAALRKLHMPSSVKDWESGRHRVLLDDLLEFQLGLALRRRSSRILQAVPIEVSAKVDARIRRLFRFRFTSGQDTAIADIVKDIRMSQPMHRLLQADVGAGKTAVAVYAMLAAVAAGKQAVLMAPTEVLATQHWETFDELLAESKVNRCLLLGGLPAAKRRELLQSIADGSMHLVIGTQAVIQDSVQFRYLAMAVIDEQHRFGVRQRAAFTGSLESPHVLVMTATPIPRSLCLTQFGDLDVSVIRDLPPGRQKVVTARIMSSPEQARVWGFLREQIAAGRQAYIVCPRVEGQSEDDVASAEAVYRQLSQSVLSGLRVDLLHGAWTETDVMT